MTRRIALLLTTLLVVAACGPGDGAESTTTAAETTTTTAAETTTTTAAETTTTSVAQEEGSSEGLASIRAAIAQSAELTSARMEGLIEVTGAVEDGQVMDITMPFGGTFDHSTGNSSFYMDLSGFTGMGGEEVPAEFADMFGEMEIRVIDGISYIKFPFFAMMFGAETPWISAPAEEGEDFVADFSFGAADDPTGVLQDLEDADAEVTEIGRETINGVETTHYRVIFDAAEIYAQATPEERAEMEAEGFIPDGEFPVDLWISDDGWIIRYVMDVDGASFGGDDEFERMVMTFNLYDINQPVSIVAPDPSEVTDVDSLSFFGMSSG
ncbi:MAG TPA: hypothetical protein VLB67_11130 [Acidimicrobiia bacterium]|nr:hypothetical protein [Acidimicrobiia bacterium]